MRTLIVPGVRPSSSASRRCDTPRSPPIRVSVTSTAKLGAVRS
jgi:hypothetical protein